MHESAAVATQVYQRTKEDGQLQHVKHSARRQAWAVRKKHVPPGG